ncbi:hypothetical protein [Staphylococcus aureus]|nr:hypothetical protein [Staphylococcus aureus]
MKTVAEKIPMEDIAEIANALKVTPRIFTIKKIDKQKTKYNIVQLI